MGSYSPPSVGPAGLTIPTYSEILQDNLDGFLNIFGNNQYTGPDSAIYQLLSILSLKNADCCAGLQLVYNQSSPATAVGAGLDRVVKMNGIARLAAGFSTAIETIAGTSGTVITNGVVEDVNGNLWTLPPSVTIPSGGTTTVTVICTTPGNIAAEPGQINIISTPVGGWTSATNAAAATPGAPVETDSQLRARQAISVALPSLTRLDGTIAAIAEVPGVTQYLVLENPTGSTDGYGNPAHSITAVVAGGTNLAVATAIYNNKSIGCYTNGTTTQDVTDPVTGVVTAINFYRPTEVPIYVGITVHGLSGYTSATLVAILAAIVGYLNSLQIGEEVTLSALYAVAMSVTPNLASPEYSVKSLTLGTSASAAFAATVDALGSGYVVNDVVTLVQGGASGGTFTVTSVNGSGGVTGISAAATTGGTNYSPATGLSTTGGTGTGLTLNLIEVAPSGTSDISLSFYDLAEGIAANIVGASV